jgi:hypothetical protein
VASLPPRLSAKAHTAVNNARPVSADEGALQPIPPNAFYILAMIAVLFASFAVVAAARRSPNSAIRRLLVNAEVPSVVALTVYGTLVSIVPLSDNGLKVAGVITVLALGAACIVCNFVSRSEAEQKRLRERSTDKAEFASAAQRERIKNLIDGLYEVQDKLNPLTRDFRRASIQGDPGASKLEEDAVESFRRDYESNLFTLTGRLNEEKINVNPLADAMNVGVYSADQIDHISQVLLRLLQDLSNSGF